MYFASSAERFAKMVRMVSSVAGLKAGGALIVGDPIVPPLATVSNAQTFQTTIPANAIRAKVNSMSQSRIGSTLAPERILLKRGPIELNVFMDGN